MNGIVFGGLIVLAVIGFAIVLTASIPEDKDPPEDYGRLG